MPASRRELERAPGTLLAPHVPQVERTSSRLPVGGDVLRRLELSAQVRHGVGEMPDADRLDSGKRRLRARLVRTDEPLEPCTPRAFGNGEHASDAPEPAVERELTARCMLGEPIARDLPRRGQKRERDWQIEARALLLQLGGREIDRRPVAGPFELGGFDPAPDALLRLLAGAVDKADDGERRHAALNVRLHLDTARLQADEGKGDRAREHASKLRRHP